MTRTAYRSDDERRRSALTATPANSAKGTNCHRECTSTQPSRSTISFMTAFLWKFRAERNIGSSLLPVHLIEQFASFRDLGLRRLPTGERLQHETHGGTVVDFLNHLVEKLLRGF